MSESKEVFIGIVGSRTRNKREDYDKIHDAYLDIIGRFEYDRAHFTIISGGAWQGGDKFAMDIARDNGHKMVIYFPDLQGYGLEFEGKNTEAYHARNEVIARESDILIAAPVERWCGTKDTMFRFQRLHPNRELIVV